MTSYTPLILKTLHDISISEKNTFKTIAYKKAIQNLKDLHISSIDDIKHISGIGKSISLKIKNIIDNNIPSPITLNSFTDIYGIGNVKSNELINTHNITCIQELKNNTHLLNNKQQIGLKYYEDLLKPIPYSEMLLHSTFIYNSIQNTEPHSVSSIVGSFRRKKNFSGDIDVLIVSNLSIKLFVSNLGPYILEILALSDKKFMGICKIDKIYRRIDMLITTPIEFPYAELYFTGSKEHNIFMRNKAKKLGYSLNEKGLDKINSDTKDVPIMKNEKDIFKFLDIDYKIPENR